jgi:ketosteroid isomerase-like protein
MSQQNVNIVQGAYEAFGRGDIPNVLANFDPQIEWIEPDVPGAWFSGIHHGSETVAQEVFAGVPKFMEEFRIETEEFLDAGDSVVVLGRFRGRGKSTGKELNSPFAHVWKLHNGKAMRFQNYEDTLNWLRALGQPPG